MRIQLFLALAWVALCFGLPSKAESWGAVTIRETTVAPGAKLKFRFAKARTFDSEFLDFPIWVARGSAPGPTLCLSAGIHGDELNGPAIAHRVFAGTDPSRLAGTLIATPAVNASGFRSGSRYMPDRRDLNRYFPGKLDGSVASLVAYAAFENVVRICDALIDLHTGSLKRRNLPQVRVDPSHERALSIARSFGVGIVIAGDGPEGSLRRAAMDAGIPAVIYEAGGPHRLEVHEIEAGERGVRNVMAYLGMLSGTPRPEEKARLFTETDWVRVPPGHGGFFFPALELGATVAVGDLLGTVTDPQSDEVHEIRSPKAGEVIGMAEPQVVLSGYALFHLGLGP